MLEAFFVNNKVGLVAPSAARIDNISDENTGSCRGGEFGVLLGLAWFWNVIYQRSKWDEVAFKVLSVSEEVW